MPDKNQTIKVLFNDLNEFIEEFKKAPPQIEKVLRVTKQLTSSSLSPNIQLVTVVATYLHQPHRISQKTGRFEDVGPLHIIELRRCCGDWWQGTGDNKPVERAEAVMSILEDAAKGQGVETRAGIYTITP